jgi:hypothetical protein
MGIAMNRRERRRRAKLGDVVEVTFGRVVFDIKPGADTSRDVCYVCGKPATPWPHPIERDRMAHGFATINGGKPVLLCEDCFKTDKTTNAIVRKYWNAPDMKVSKGGTYDDIDEIREIARAIADRGDKPTN